MRIDRSPILVLGSHRGGTTWVGKMIGQSPLTYYIGEAFNPGSQLLADPLLQHTFPYVVSNSAEPYRQAIQELIDLSFRWPRHRERRGIVPSRLVLLQLLRQQTGLPRPILKEPLGALSAEWLAESFDMKVILVVRHPAAFVASVCRVGWRFDFRHFLAQPQLMCDWFEPWRHELECPSGDPVGEAALLWRCLFHVLSGYQKRQPGWSVWRYQDVARAPMEAFTQIYSQLGLPMTGYERARIRSYSLSQNAVDAPRSDPHLIRRDSSALVERWRDLLSVSDIQRVRALTEPVASQYFGDADW